MSTHCHSLLCLGDSYTIGEGIPLHESFPYQCLQLLRKSGLHFHAPEIIAQTGWTSFELADHLINQTLNDSYDFVSLLIGVNNQYRGLPIKEFSEEFEFLLKKAVHLAGGKSDHVVVLSIPDWSCTPYAAKKPVASIAKEIDAFNEQCKSIAVKYHCPFIDITTATRNTRGQNGMLAADELHYSAKLYALWAQELSEAISRRIVHPIK